MKATSMKALSGSPAPSPAPGRHRGRQGYTPFVGFGFLQDGEIDVH
jgi:hypothetical protein